MWKQKAKGAWQNTLKIWAKFIRKDKRMIIFSSFDGRGYSDSPRAMFEYMKSDTQYTDFTFVFALKKGVDVTIPAATVVRTKTLKYFYYLLKAKYWVFNARMPDYLYKKDDQIYLQTWHGTPLKRLADDINQSNNVFTNGQTSYKNMIRGYEIESERWDYLLAYSPYTESIFRSAFMYQDKPVIQAGLPRNQRLIDATTDEKAELRGRYNIPQDKKVILYAPTYRDDASDDGTNCSLEVNFKLWRELLGDEYYVVFKPHYFIKQVDTDISHMTDFVQEIDAGAEINDLYIMSDVLITDYSSVFFDYALLGRPIYFYMYDFDKYKNQLRGFYLDVKHDLPNKIHTSEIEMLEAVKANDFDTQVLAEFNEKFNPWQRKDTIKRILNELI
ncbi:CDP-glycerol glycerophosphotransferase family protein [Weissella ceti]|uniref:CDP-glycerol glycerophosphotransferase family protein n=1 Tax=Weissella ceti TaxID=759620 RepID=A0ABT3E3H1_9LACO|nr:CDP-glycerol glycerophosphotransferase family protein [Weissella ceti]MCW0952958.1 CDP-glycerol glycerophosphotransferase family protein [Weissella ceti]QVK11503.1 CDP-glycerol glycerophosphotransferase family protein [Weissella ceti]